MTEIQEGSKVAREFRAEISLVDAATGEVNRTLNSVRAALVSAESQTMAALRRAVSAGTIYNGYSWSPSCPFGDVCTGCDALGHCTRMSSEDATRPTPESQTVNVNYGCGHVVTQPNDGVYRGICPVCERET